MHRMYKSMYECWYSLNSTHSVADKICNSLRIDQINKILKCSQKYKFVHNISPQYICIFGRMNCQFCAVSKVNSSSFERTIFKLFVLILKRNIFFYAY